MKLWLLTILALECVILGSCFKLIDSDLFENDHPYVNYKRDNYANKQSDLFDLDDNENEQYERTLAQLAAAAAAQKAYTSPSDYQFDPSEVNSEELVDLDDNRYDDDQIRADQRDEETESHSSLGSGHQYVSGGAGEGKQHLQPDGSIPNRDEVKSDEDLPAYCDPPNPCPVGYSGDDCDARPYEEFTAEFSKNYQEHQNCMCDDDHNECKRAIRSKSNDKIADLIREIQTSKADDRFSAVVAKKSPSPRFRRDVSSSKKNKTKVNPYIHKLQPIKVHVAKKSAPF